MIGLIDSRDSLFLNAKEFEDHIDRLFARLVNILGLDLAPKTRNFTKALISMINEFFIIVRFINALWINIRVI